MPTPATIRAMREAVAHHQAGRLSAAEEIYRRVLQNDPRDADALQLLGLLNHQAGRHEDAVQLISRAIAIRPQAEFFVNLSQAYRAMGKRNESLDACMRAVRIAPQLPEAWSNYGSALKDAGRTGESIQAFAKALSLRPNYAVAMNNLGNAQAELNDAIAAEKTLRHAIAVDPNYAEAHSNLAHLLSSLGRLDETINECERAIALRPNLVAAYMNLGTALHLQGRLDEGNAVYERGRQIDRSHAGLQANLLGSFNYTTRSSARDSREAHVAWAERFAMPSAPALLHQNDCNSDRRLRIGYVSPDFKRHSVAYFLEPILAHHDRARFEITAYSNVRMPDEMTGRLRALCDRWRDISALNDDEAADLVRADGIDVLIDLAGHTTGHRLGLFARRPAPVQMTYLGYPNTTGIAQIDYRITDALADPLGMTEEGYCERLLRIEPPFLCYQPPQNSPPVADPPMAGNGFITFGSFNKIAKAGVETIALWAAVLRAMPDARLILKSAGLSSAGSRRRLFDAFSAQGIDAQRIEAIEAGQTLSDHLAMYARIDIALDTFPYHGTTTTCEALWMGVPVITLAGTTHASRVGVSLLSAIGRTAWVAADQDVFVSIARQLTADAAQLKTLRHDLRDELTNASLCDGARLTRQLEHGYRAAFAEWAKAIKSGNA